MVLGFFLFDNSIRGRPYMTSDDFCRVLTPPPPLIRCFISTALLIKLDLAEPPSPLPSSDIIYGRPLSNPITLPLETFVCLLLTWVVSEPGSVNGFQGLHYT